MPEGPEIETEKLHESVTEAVERRDSGLLRTIALTTAILAVVASLLGLALVMPLSAAKKLSSQ